MGYDATNLVKSANAAQKKLNESKKKKKATPSAISKLFKGWGKTSEEKYNIGTLPEKKCDGGIIGEDEKKKAKMKALKALGNK